MADNVNYDPSVCLQNLNDKGLTPTCQTLNPPWHCVDLTTAGGAYHKFCADSGIVYQPIAMLYCANPQTGISQYFPPDTIFAQCAAMGAPWVGGTCYCCCSCFANDTLIATPDGAKEIYLIRKKDHVLTAAVNSDAGKVQVHWSKTQVSFSAGTSSKGQQPLMIYLSLKDKEKKRHELICNMEQPFLLADGKYTTAGKLHPGQRLVDKDGDPVLVELLSIGSYQGGVHHISTEKPWTKNPDGHLLLAGGVVAGDYTLQLYFNELPASMKEPDLHAKPLIGTPAYEQAYSGKIKRSDVLFEFVGANAPSEHAGQRQLTTGLFTAYRVAGTDIPYGAQALFTQDQSIDIAKNGLQTPLSNPIPVAIFNTIKAQLTGFFPDIDFYYETLETLPNVYAFTAYGRKTVVITGGLARMKLFGYEGMLMAISHGIACFYGGDPKNVFGYSAVGQADWFAYGVISRLVWIGQPYVAYITAAIQQWQALFALVDPEHAQGNPLDPLNDPSLECRYKTIQSAAGGGNLPECAGGAPLPKISLQTATAGPDGAIIANFSVALENTSGSDVANYILTPAAKVTSATLDSTTGLIVHLQAALEPGTQYVLKVQNLVSILGSGVDPQHDSVNVKTD